MITPLLDPRLAAELLGITRRQIVTLVRQGEIPCIELPNGEVRFTEADLRIFLECHRRPILEKHQIVTA